MGSKALGGIADTNAQIGDYKTQARVEAENARRFEFEAGSAFSVGARNEEQQRRGYRDFAGREAAASGEGGLAFTGSLMDIVRQSETRANLDALKLRYEGVSKGSSLMDQSRQALARSKLAKAMAKRESSLGLVRLIDPAIGDGLRIASDAYGVRKKGGG